MQRLTLFAEAGSWPVWDEAGDAIDPASLGLSDELLAELVTWSRRLRDADGYFPDPDERRAFDDEGRKLWQRASSELQGRAALDWRATFREETAGRAS